MIALRNIAAAYPYDVAQTLIQLGICIADEGSLRGSRSLQNHSDEICQRWNAGLEINEARIT